MRKVCYFLFAIVLFSFSLMSQDTSFTFTKSGFTDFVVTSCEGKTKSDIYKKTLHWISETYQNPDKVIKGNVENEYIRIEGSSKELVCVPFLGGMTCPESIYQVEISFKDGKYKFDVLGIKMYMEPIGSVPGKWENVDILNTSKYYNDAGEIRKMSRYFESKIPAYFNTLNNQLKSRIMKAEDQW